MPDYYYLILGFLLLVALAALVAKRRSSKIDYIAPEHRAKENELYEALGVEKPHPEEEPKDHEDKQKEVEAAFASAKSNKKSKKKKKSRKGRKKSITALPFNEIYLFLL